MTGMQNDWKDTRSRCNIFRLLIGLECGATMFSQSHVIKFISASKRVQVSTWYGMNLAFVYIKDKVSNHYKNVELQMRLHVKIFPARNLCGNFSTNKKSSNPATSLAFDDPVTPKKLADITLWIVWRICCCEKENTKLLSVKVSATFLSKVFGVYKVYYSAIFLRKHCVFKKTGVKAKIHFTKSAFTKD